MVLENLGYLTIVVLLLLISVPISHPVAAQTDDTCPDGSQPNVNGECPSQEGSASDDSSSGESG
jgi:hypothetical protein